MVLNSLAGPVLFIVLTPPSGPLFVLGALFSNFTQKENPKLFWGAWNFVSQDVGRLQKSTTSIPSSPSSLFHPSSSGMHSFLAVCKSFLSILHQTYLFMFQDWGKTSQYTSGTESTQQQDRKTWRLKMAIHAYLDLIVSCRKEMMHS